MEVSHVKMQTMQNCTNWGFFFSLDSAIKLYHCVMYFTEGWIVNASSESSQIRVNLIVLSLLIISFSFYFFFFSYYRWWHSNWWTIQVSCWFLIFPRSNWYSTYVFWPFYSLADYLRIFSGASLNLCKPGCTTLTCEQRFFPSWL